MKVGGFLVKEVKALCRVIIGLLCCVQLIWRRRLPSMVFNVLFIAQLSKIYPYLVAP